MRSLAAVALLAGALLAGCTSSAGPPADAPDASFDDLDLQPTASTGIIRGIVVDDAIRPIAGALVVLNGGDAPKETSTTEGGVFGFADLAPGTYFLKVSKLGYFDAQQSTEVVAGLADPPIVKVLLAVNVDATPYFEQFVLDGYIECGVTTPAIAAAVCSVPNEATCGDPFPAETCYGNVTNDVFVQFIPVEKPPSWIQHEVIWQATQSTGDMFRLAARTSTYEQNRGGAYEAGIKSGLGVSPLLITINATEIEEDDIGIDGLGLAPAIFAGGMAGTEQCVPVANPVVNCLFATGATLSQRFQMFTHVFYGYEPTEGWRFSSGEPVPVPA